MAPSRWDRFSAWFRGAPAVPSRWRHCPICGAELAGPYPAGARVAGPAGPLSLEPTDAELIAKCPEHGHPPFNVPPD